MIMIIIIWSIMTKKNLKPDCPTCRQSNLLAWWPLALHICCCGNLFSLFLMMFLCRRRRCCWRCRTPKQESSHSLSDWLSQQYHMLLLVKRTHYTHTHTHWQMHIYSSTHLMLFSGWLSDFPCIVSLEDTTAPGSNSRATDFISMTTPAVSESEREGKSRRWRRRMMIEWARGRKKTETETQRETVRRWWWWRRTKQMNEA